MRIAGVVIPSKKKVKIALRYIYGIGPYIANLICQDSGIDPEKRVNDLNPDEISKIMSAIKKHPTEGDLRSKIMLNIRRLVSIGCYRGQRHKKGLPVRGQRTHTNAKTSKKLLKAFRV